MLVTEHSKKQLRVVTEENLLQEDPSSSYNGKELISLVTETNNYRTRFRFPLFPLSPPLVTSVLP